MLKFFEDLLQKAFFFSTFTGSDTVGNVNDTTLKIRKFE